MILKSFHKDIEVVPRRVLFSILKIKPRSNPETQYFSIENDEQFNYKPYYDDFGPPSLLQLYTFTRKVQEMMEQFKGKIHFYTPPTPNIKANSIMYISFFRMIYLQVSADEAYDPFANLSGVLRPYRDASNLQSVFDLTIQDCLRGAAKAISNNWFDYMTFDPREWYTMEQLEKGDMNWIIPGKLLAFASPYSNSYLPGGIKVATPADIIPIFQQIGITHVIRLNKQFYDAKDFIDAGIGHTELFFPDGSIPTQLILDKFMDVVENEEVVAIHCRAGLGRTGTLAACYMIKNFRFSGREAIGWIRICRPGSILGQQQQFLLKYASEAINISTGPFVSTARQVHRRYPTPPLTPRLFLTPQRGFRFNNKAMIDGYNNNPKSRKPQIIRVIREMYKDPETPFFVRAQQIRASLPPDLLPSPRKTPKSSRKV